MERNCKTQLWDEKQNRALFLDHPVENTTALLYFVKMGGGEGGQGTKWY